MGWFRTAPEGLVVTVRLTPRGGRDAIDGIVSLADGRQALAARVRAAPEEGAANAALAVLLARAFARPKSMVRLIGGATGRLKQVAISGDSQALAAIAGSIGGDPKA